MIETIVAFSDSHEQHQKLQIPDGDLLICAGDFTWRGQLSAVVEFNEWLGKLPHRHKVVIAGNHDWLFFQNPNALPKLILSNATYLEDSLTDIEGVKIWGTPWSPRFFRWAFMADRGKDIRRHWDKIPHGLDILVVHTPPFGILDKTSDGEDVGCRDLLDRIHEVKPRIVICGHIHEGYGTHCESGIVFFNASVLDERYRPSNLAHVIRWSEFC